ncbi:hypothetical protein R6Q59_013122 [Mikania micrantha]
MENSIDAKDQLDHFSHRHSLSLVYLQQKNENDNDEDEDRDEEAEDEFVEENLHGGECNMCKEHILSFDVCYYYCKPCDYSLHKFCAELPFKLQNHPLHPQHELKLRPYYFTEIRCFICNLDRKNDHIYACYTCKLAIDINCATSRERKINHPSHPHQMELMPQSIVSSCSACDNKHEGRFFLCTTCHGFWINKDCALLPAKMLIQNHTNGTFIHSHPLTLAYTFPYSDREAKFNPKCRVCQRRFFYFHLWIYKCDKCRYYVHVDCATSKEEPFMFIFQPQGAGILHKNFKDVEHPNLLHCPFDNEEDNLLKHHMSNQIELTGEKHDANTLNHSGHRHPLILFNKQTSDGEKTISLHNPMKKIQQLCDGCVKPITTVPFYVCNQQADEQCCFILHEWCAKLPLKIQDYTGHPYHTLYLRPKVPRRLFSVFTCAICDLPSNGFAYGCKMCEFYVDINCAFIPEQIIHDAHPGHLLYKIYPSTLEENCKACFDHMYHRWGFRCPSCDFYIHVGCALLLYRVIKHKCDKHPLSLRYGPVENHISDYFCEICEDPFNPWKWFYHCTKCRQSLHTSCVPLIIQYEQATYIHKSPVTGVYKFLNVKFGGMFKIKGHPHRLTFVQGIHNDGRCHKCGRRLEEEMIFKCLECKFGLHYYCTPLLTLD